MSFRDGGRGASGGVEAQDAQIAGGFADFREGRFELGGRIGFKIQEKLIFPGAAVDGAAFDFLEVDAVLCERLERGEKGPGAMREAHGDGHFVGVGGRRGSFSSRAEQEEAGEIFGVVLDAGKKDDSAVVLCGPAGGDGGAGFVAVGEGFANASGGVFRGDAFEVRVGYEETLALG